MGEAWAAGDRADEAVAVAVRHARTFGAEREPQVLHTANNVVVRLGDVVVKVGSRWTGLALEHEVATHVHGRGGPCLAPIGEVVRDGDWVLTAWPFVEVDAEPAAAVVAARALADLHRALADVPLPPPPPAGEGWPAVVAVLEDREVMRALSDADVALLRRAFGQADDDEPADLVVLHGDPHGGNQLCVGGEVTFIDLEGVRLGALEGELAYFDDDVIAEVWPDHDPERLRKARLSLSATVAVWCWRAVGARGDDEHHRFHGQHHLDVVRSLLT